MRGWAHFPAGVEGAGLEGTSRAPPPGIDGGPAGVAGARSQDSVGELQGSASGIPSGVFDHPAGIGSGSLRGGGGACLRVTAGVPSGFGTESMRTPPEARFQTGSAHGEPGFSSDTGSLQHAPRVPPISAILSNRTGALVAPLERSTVVAAPLSLTGSAPAFER